MRARAVGEPDMRRTGAPSPPRRIAVHASMLVTAIIVLLLQAHMPAFAEVRVAGSREAVRIDAKQATLSELMSQLAGTFGLRYRLSGEIDRPISGRYEGPLNQVVTRMLQQHGYNFVVTRSSEIMTIHVVGVALPASAVVVPQVDRGPSAAALDAVRMQRSAR